MFFSLDLKVSNVCSPTFQFVQQKRLRRRTAHVTVVMVESRNYKPRPWTFTSHEACVIDLEYVFLFLLIDPFFIFVL